MKRPRATKKVRLSEQVKSVTLVDAPVEKCVSAIRRSWARFGPTEVTPLAKWRATKDFLLPLKSFKTKIVVAPLQAATVLIKDMYGEDSFVNALAASKNLRVQVLGAILQDERRIIRYAASGKITREVAYYVEDGSWTYAAKGEPLPSERDIGVEDESLTLSNAVRIVKETMNVALPPVWSELREAVGISRSLSAIRVPILNWTTIDDVGE